MDDRCGKCKYSTVGPGAFKNRLLCAFIPPASIAKALDLTDQYQIEHAEVHPDWSCSLFTEDDT